ncbi:MAG: hypothetical protein MI723_00095, partial [Caulobacterales bacterium]|nr:hypothetical protein [Caulobacterales bacterium]
MTRPIAFAGACALLAAPAVADDAGAVRAEDLARRIEALASDDFAGRAPATEGGRAASQWIADEMASIGLEPAGDDGTFFQAVPLVEITLDA